MEVQVFEGLEYLTFYPEGFQKDKKPLGDFLAWGGISQAGN